MSGIALGRDPGNQAGRAARNLCGDRFATRAAVVVAAACASLAAAQPAAARPAAPLSASRAQTLIRADERRHGGRDVAVGPCWRPGQLLVRCHVTDVGEVYLNGRPAPATLSFVDTAVGHSRYVVVVNSFFTYRYLVARGGPRDHLARRGLAPGRPADRRSRSGARR